jgi:hypothetical protein
MMVSTTPAWGMEPTSSSLGAVSPYHQAKARGGSIADIRRLDLEKLIAIANPNQSLEFLKDG